MSWDDVQFENLSKSLLNKVLNSYTMEKFKLFENWISMISQKEYTNRKNWSRLSYGSFKSFTLWTLYKFVETNLYTFEWEE
jgi:hypothetical protein